MASFVLESIAVSYDGYKLLLERLAKLVKPNGHFLMFGVENNQGYTVGDKMLRDFPVTEDMAVATIEECGFSVTKIDKFPNNHVIYMFISAINTTPGESHISDLWLYHYVSLQFSIMLAMQY